MECRTLNDVVYECKVQVTTSSARIRAFGHGRSPAEDPEATRAVSPKWVKSRFSKSGGDRRLNFSTGPFRFTLLVLDTTWKEEKEI